MIRADQAMRLELPEKIARRLKITEGNSLHIIAHQIHDRIAHFGEAMASEDSRPVEEPLCHGSCWRVS